MPFGVGDALDEAPRALGLRVTREVVPEVGAVIRVLAMREFMGDHVVDHVARPFPNPAADTDILTDKNTSMPPFLQELQDAVDHCFNT